MPRTARQVIPGVPHHITQRGDQRRQVFFTPKDYQTFLYYLRKRAKAHQVGINAYCLMPNHYHVVATPQTKNGLALVFGHLDESWTLRWHELHNTTGHLWQGRFYSCPLGDSHLCEALRYVENNATRALLARLPWDYLWSSARAHVTGYDPYRLLDMKSWAQLYTLDDWRELLQQVIEPDIIQQLRDATQFGKWFR
jgi:putative transposase